MKPLTNKQFIQIETMARAKARLEGESRALRNADRSLLDEIAHAKRGLAEDRYPDPERRALVEQRVQRLGESRHNVTEDQRAAGERLRAIAGPLDELTRHISASLGDLGLDHVYTPSSQIHII